MKLIIDIPDDDYKFIKDLRFYYSGRRSGKTIEQNVINGIRNGKPYEERPQGEWIEDYYAGIHCSECDYFPLKDVIIKIYTDGSKVKSGNYNLTPYCPNCGADMRGGRE